MIIDYYLYIMEILNIDGWPVKVSFSGFHGERAKRVMELLIENKPFRLFSKDDKEGVIYFPEQLACLDHGDLLFYSGLTEFQFGLSFNVGVQDSVCALSDSEKDKYISRINPLPAIDCNRDAEAPLLDFGQEDKEQCTGS